MAKRKIEEKYKKLNDREHVLLRPSMYISSIKPHISNKYIFNGTNMESVEINYNPGFIKIFDEIITNSVDEHKRNTGLNIIKVTIENDIISIWDNGGIEVVKHKEHKEWIPELVFSNLKAGSNFTDSDARTGAGTHGVGSSLTNIFSKEFTISTCDGINSFHQIFSDNMANRTKPIIKKSKKSHTEIKYIPDYSRFDMSGMDENHFKLIQKRVIDIAACNPQIKIYFNGELIKFRSFDDYIKLYSSDYYCEMNSEKNWSVGISKSDNGYKQISFINSNETTDGGTHVDYVVNQIIGELKKYFLKKYKIDIKPSDIKNHITIYINSTIINPTFSSQSKEKLTTDAKDFGFTYNISDKMVKWILKSEIVESINSWILQKKEADELKLKRDLNKSLSKIKVDKLIDAKGKERWKCSLNIFEGDSASKSARKYRDPMIQGIFSLRGKFINVTDITNIKLSQNKEAIDLMAALGLKLGSKVIPGTLRYGKIILYTDADFDGDGIAAQLINFFHNYWPELFEQELIFRSQTPIVVVKNIKNKKKIPFYTNLEYENWISKISEKDWEIKYKKGLAALTDDEYKEIIQKPKLIKILKDDESQKNLTIWFGKDPTLRKEALIQ